MDRIMHAPDKEMYQGAHVALRDVDGVLVISLQVYRFEVNYCYCIIDVHATQRMSIYNSILQENLP